MLKHLKAVKAAKKEAAAKAAAKAAVAAEKTFDVSVYKMLEPEGKYAAIYKAAYEAALATN